MGCCGDKGADEPRGLSPTVMRVLVGRRDAFLTFLERRVASADIAREILQDTFARSLERGGQLRDEAAAVAWFYQMLRNALADRRRRHEAADRALTQLAHEVDTSDDLPALAADGAPCTCVLRELDALKPEYAQALREIEIEGTPVKSFAGSQGITANNAGVRVHRAREALGRRVRATCGSCAESGCARCSCGVR